MTGSPPTLRLVAAGDENANSDSTSILPSFVTDWESLCASFTCATGARLAFRGPRDPEFPSAAVWETEVPAAGAYAPGTLGLLASNKQPSDSATAEAAQVLAEHIGELTQQLHESHRTLWQRNAELATAVPMIVDAHEQAAQLAERFGALLASAARASGGDSAAMFILDDATQLLQLRSHHGLDHGHFTSAARELRHAPADVEALTGHAIVLDDATDNLALLPEIACDAASPGAAICVPISSANVPLGTLWIFAENPTEFSDVQVDMTEIIAGRLAVELEREILLREQGALGSSGHVSDAIDWQRAQLPTCSDLDSGKSRWQLAARAASQSRLHGDFYRWQLENDDTVKLALSTSHARGIPAALSASRVGGLLGLDYLDPAKRLAEINAALWSGSAGDDQSSIFLGQLNESTGELLFCAAGLIDAYVIRPHGWEPIAELNDTPLGILEDAEWQSYQCTIEPGDTLLVLSGRPRLRACTTVDGQVDGPHYAEAALHHNHLDAEQLTLLLSGLWDHQTSPWAMPPAQLIARRI